MEFNRAELRKDVMTKRCIEDDITVELAAKQIGISSSVLCHLEQKKDKSITLTTLAKLCTWLNTDPGKYFK